MTLLDQIRKCLKDDRIIVVSESEQNNLSDDGSSDSDFCEMRFSVVPKDGIYELNQQSIRSLNDLLNNIFGILTDFGTSNPFMNISGVDYETMVEEGKNPPDKVNIHEYELSRRNKDYQIASVGRIIASETVGRLHSYKTERYVIDEKCHHEFDPEDHEKIVQEDDERIPLIRTVNINLFPSLAFMNKWDDANKQPFNEGRMKAFFDKVLVCRGNGNYEIVIGEYNRLFRPKIRK